MPIIRTTWTDDDGTGQTGSVIDNAWLQTLYGQIDDYVGGAWTNIPHSAANYTASSGTWTLSAPPTNFQYMVIGGPGAGKRTAFYVFTYGGTSVLSAAPTFLYLTLPAGLPAPASPVSTPLMWIMNGLSGTGLIQMPGGSRLELIRDIFGSPWPASSSANHMRAAWFYSF